MTKQCLFICLTITAILLGEVLTKSPAAKSTKIETVTPQCPREKYNEEIRQKIYQKLVDKHNSHFNYDKSDYPAILKKGCHEDNCFKATVTAPLKPSKTKIPTQYV